MTEASTNGRLTAREQFLKPAARRFIEVQLPNGSRVRIRSLTEKEKSDFEAAILTERGTANRRRIAETTRRLIVLTLVDENGDLLLQPGDVGAVEQLDCAITSFLADRIAEHCGFREGEIEDWVKNSERITGDVSPTV